MNETEYNLILEKFRAHGHKFFSVTFARRNDKIVKGKVIEAAGTVRTMVCLMGIKPEGAKGPNPDRAEQDRKNAVITVYGVHEQGYRSIPVDSIISMTGVENA